MPTAALLLIKVYRQLGSDPIQFIYLRLLGFQMI